MSSKSSSTAGVQVYILNSLVSPQVALLVPQLKGITPLGGGHVKKIDVSNFDSKGDDEYVGGRGAPSESSGELILDMTSVGQQTVKAIFEASKQGTIGIIQLYVGQSGSTAAPTVVAGILTPPQTASPKHWARTGQLISGYVSDITSKVADNDVWKADFKFQATGPTEWSVKGDVVSKTY